MGMLIQKANAPPPFFALENQKIHNLLCNLFAPLSNFLKRVVFIVVYYELEFLIFKQPELRTGVVQLSQSQMAVYNNKAQLANPC